MIDRRGFFAFALNAAAAGAAGVLIAAPAMAQDGPNHRRRARNGAAKPQQQQDTAANVAQPHAPNHRRGRQLRTQSQTAEVVADIEWDAQPRQSGPVRRR